MRRTSDGRVLGFKPRDDRSYCQRQADAPLRTCACGREAYVTGTEAEDPWRCDECRQRSVRGL